VLCFLFDVSSSSILCTQCCQFLWIILGGTIDVTSYQVQDDSELKELHIPSGGPWGGTCVDREYLAFLENLLS
jgi:hypothetical protein